MHETHYVCSGVSLNQDTPVCVIDVYDHPPAACLVWSVNYMPVISTPPEVDIHNVALLRHALVDAPANAAAVILDMTATTFCDAATIGAIIATAKSMHSNRRELLLVVATEQVTRVMEILNVGQHCQILPSLSAALTVTGQSASAYGYAA